MLQIEGPDGLSERTIITAELDGAEYELSFLWNGLFEAWYLDLSLFNGALLVAGVRLTSLWPLLNLHTNTNANIPQGVLMVLPMTDDKSNPGQFDLASGARCRLVYITRQEALAMREIADAARDDGLRVRRVED